jgi:hypothetical protein
MEDVAAVNKLVLMVIEQRVTRVLPGSKSTEEVTFDDVIRKINAAAAGWSVTQISK